MPRGIGDGALYGVLIHLCIHDKPLNGIGHLRLEDCGKSFGIGLGFGVFCIAHSQHHQSRIAVSTTQGHKTLRHRPGSITAEITRQQQRTIASGQAQGAKRAPCYGRGGQPVTIHQRAAMGDVIAKATRRNKMGHRAVQRQAVGRPGKMPRCVIAL